MISDHRLQTAFWIGLGLLALWLLYLLGPILTPFLLARILWHLLKFKQPFNPEVFAHEEQKMKRKRLARLQSLAASMKYELIPQP